MSRPVDFHRMARRELSAVYGWYKHRSARAVEQFLIRMDDAIERIAGDPEAMPRLGRNYHWCRVRRFPYQVVFRIEPDSSVYIIAIAHLSRRTGYWRNRK